MEIDPKLRIIVGVLTLVLAAVAMFWGSAELDAKPGGGEFEVLFAESVEGLSVNSPVTYMGRPVGKVLGIKQEPRNDRIYTRVRFGVNAEVKIYKQEVVIEKVIFTPPGRNDWFRGGDEILAVGDEPVATVRGYSQELGQWFDDLSHVEIVPPGTSLDVKVRRDGSEMSVKVLFEEDVPKLRFKVQGTRAVLSSNFVTGIKTIQLVGGRGDLDLVASGKVISSDVSALGGFLESMSRDGTRLMSNLTAISSEGKILMRSINRSIKDGKLNRILSNIETLTKPEEVRALLEPITTAANNASSLFKELEGFVAEDSELMKLLKSISKQLEEGGDLAGIFAKGNQALGEGGVIRDTVAEVQRTFEALNDMLAEGGELRMAVAAARTLFARLEKEVGPEGKLGARLDELGYVMRNDLRRTLASLTSALKAVEDGIHRLVHQNPSSLLMGTKGEK